MSDNLCSLLDLTKTVFSSDRDSHIFATNILNQRVATFRDKEEPTQLQNMKADIAMAETRISGTMLSAEKFGKSES